MEEIKSWTANIVSLSSGWWWSVDPQWGYGSYVGNLTLLLQHCRATDVSVRQVCHNKPTRLVNGISHNHLDHVATFPSFLLCLGQWDKFEISALTTVITPRLCARHLLLLHLLLKWPSFSSGINKVHFISDISHNTSIALQCQIAGGCSADVITSQSLPWRRCPSTSLI